MKPGKSKVAGRPGEQPATDRAISLKLLQLNLHQVLANSFRAHQILDVLQQKHRGDYIFGRAFVAESAARLNEALFENCFHVNALTEGKATELFTHLDRLKARINSVLEVTSPPATGPSRDPSNLEDEVSLLLSRVVEETCGTSLSPRTTPETVLGDRPTAREMLAYLSELTLDVVDYRLSAAAESAEGLTDRIIVIPINYLDAPSPAQGAPATSETRTPTGATLNEAAELLARGIREIGGVPTSGLEQHQSGKESALKDIILHSQDTVTLFEVSRLFRCVIGAGVFDAVAGNYIYLVIAPLGRDEETAAVGRLMLRSLYWLDFDTFDSQQVICAGIRNLTRDEMGGHLNMLGKLLSFISLADVSRHDDESIQGHMEYFLENVI